MQLGRMKYRVYLKKSPSLARAKKYYSKKNYHYFNASSLWCVEEYF
jgi:hypothetical protein